MKWAIEDMHLLAAGKGGKCLSKEYAGCKTKLLWQCAKGHQWESAPSYIRRNWCPYCKGRYRTIADMQEFAARKGGRCLSKKYVNRYVKLTWQCKMKHMWKTSPCSITRGRWCPECYSLNLGIPFHLFTTSLQSLISS